MYLYMRKTKRLIFELVPLFFFNLTHSCLRVSGPAQEKNVGGVKHEKHLMGVWSSPPLKPQKKTNANRHKEKRGVNG